MNSDHHVLQFVPNDTIYEFADDDVEDEDANSTSPESLARDIYTLSGSRPNLNLDPQNLQLLSIKNHLILIPSMLQ